MAIMRMRNPSVMVINAAGVPPDTTIIAASTAPAAASAESPAEPDFWFVIVAMVLVGGIWAIVFWGNWVGLKPAAPAALAAGIGIFGLLYIAAQALERFLEPFSALDPVKKDATEKRDEMVAEALSTPTPSSAVLQAAASAQAALDRVRKNRTIIFWAAATILGMFMSSLTGIYLLDIVIDTPTPPQAADILVTGLVIGGGTKPLHDLISRVEKAKNNAEDPAETRM